MEKHNVFRKTELNFKYCLDELLIQKSDYLYCHVFQWLRRGSDWLLDLLIAYSYKQLLTITYNTLCYYTIYNNLLLITINTAMPLFQHFVVHCYTH
jgi:hypothetical protein